MSRVFVPYELGDFPSKNVICRYLAKVFTLLIIWLISGCQSNWAAQAVEKQHLLTHSAKIRPNPRPFIIPSLKNWRGSTGEFFLKNSSRIIINSPIIMPVAQLLASDLAEMTSIKPSIVESAVLLTSQAKPVMGDIVLQIDQKTQMANYRPESYKIRANKYLLLSAKQLAGLSFATRTVLQGLKQSTTGLSFPKGEIFDYPDYPERGLVLDVARKFMTKEMLKDYIRFLGFYKLNVLHLHLNDNKIGAASFNDYAAFRLASDNPKFAGLAASDGSYSRADWQELEQTAALYGVQLLPEIDGPAHALAFTRFRPDLRSQIAIDQLDLNKPQSLEFMKSIYSEFAPWFSSDTIHFGADEYVGFLDKYAEYINEIADHLASLGKKSRMWGSFDGKSIDFQSIRRRDIIIDTWENHWYSLESALNDGFVVNNVSSSALYVVPKGYFWNYSPTGLNNQTLYNFWNPEYMQPDALRYLSPASQPPASYLHKRTTVLGAKMALWHDQAAAGIRYSNQYAHSLIQDSLAVVAQKTWSAHQPLPAPYADFTAVQKRLGMGPNIQRLIDIHRDIHR